jgi:hypothetical protein
MDGGILFTDPQTFFLQVPFVNTSTRKDTKTSVDYIDTNSSNPSNIAAGTNVSKYVFSERTILRFEWEYDFEGQGATAAPIVSIVHYHGVTSNVMATAAIPLTLWRL